ncbi:PTS lactose transporter subunit IIBC [Enterococcus sp. HMSC29A04]|uniref:lactose-specific PTS transporter subunit EIIC n=1 Tax=Enterococcus TaxID=1350 RepID=UPI0007F4A36D|nr:MULTISPECIES: lactose-specific PTS transporter subunit EIIC [Enterococcus]SBA38605.1 PTS system, lactose/cellobiose-specific IICB component [Enterococcus faecium]MDT2570220.1 lactose-specific PTS transporter subunit EIIC [Enterococcus raffinosus]OFT85345.1 PTS lactose transporter subunit IIBC [Enterococcus sp. HMSC29A04]OFU64774.1 PTS lactose transporter subunit IIBC [Enterococcus sp. HMSC14A10]QXJ61474.1 PTS transporter subunit EIIC [Enterococcus raffinosus]
MKTLISRIEKMKPVFEKISNNPYLRAIRDGFISLIPVILFSSFFLLVAYVPNAFGFHWDTSIETILMKAYNGSMGILGVLMAATVTKSLTENFNSKLPKTNQINSTSTMIAAFIGFVIVGVDPIEGGFSSAFMGTKGLLTAFIIGFIVPNVYRFCVKNNITVKMPEEVPGNISQTFKDLIPITLSTVFFWLFDLGFRALANVGFSEKIIELFQPIFSAADGYLGLALIFGAMAFFWFVGIHGPSIVEPAVAAIYITNVEMNFHLYQSGEHAPKILSQGIQYFVATLGGTGATLIITLMFAFLAKSKQMKTIGRASAIPVLFGVNEPILFGAPIVLNPIFFIPFIAAPIVNVWIFKFFVDVLGMNGFIYNLPWTTPGPVGLILGTGFAGLSIVLMAILLVVDFLIYFPFFKAYDNELVAKENAEGTLAQTIVAEESVVADEVATLIKTEGSQKNVLVLCANGATSSMLANAIKKGAKEMDVEIDSTAMAYGQHKDIINEFDLIILAPQMASMLGELQESAKNYDTKTVSTTGAEYVALAKAPDQAVNFVFESLA